MAKTELGCQILQEKGHFTEFSQFIQKHSEESEDMELIMKLKSILWAVVCFCFYISIAPTHYVLETGKCGSDGRRSPLPGRGGNYTSCSGNC
jgi:hypothetical protein